MLASIHPLGERTRNHRWGITAAAFVVGAVGGGVALGVVAGGAGWIVHAVLPWSAGTAAAVAVATMALAVLGDVVRRGKTLPWPQRQVNEDWLTTYRGWVYGAGFGFQLGGGLFTYITTLGVLATIGIAFLSASPVAGAVIGASFGAFRGFAVFTTSHVRDPLELRSFHRAMAGLARPVRSAALMTQLAVVLAGIVLVVGS